MLRYIDQCLIRGSVTNRRVHDKEKDKFKKFLTSKTLSSKTNQQIKNKAVINFQILNKKSTTSINK